MKKMKSTSHVLFMVAVALLSCTAEVNNGSNGNGNPVDKTVHVTGISLDRTTVTIKEGEFFTLVPTVSPDNADNKDVIWSTSSVAVATVDNSGKVTGVKAGSATITATIKATANDGSGISASCAVCVKVPYTAVAGEAVDLGLSVKWSSVNLGATSPTHYGDYFAWGETSPKDIYSWSTYELKDSSENLLKYNNVDIAYGIVDNKTEFKDYNYEDDAARQVLGGKWRIPTDAEWAELEEKCIWTWTTQNGVNGRLVTSKTNGASIFLPAAGYRVGGYYIYDRYPTELGTAGAYWSSSLNSSLNTGSSHHSPYYAWALYLKSASVRRGEWTRYDGLSVRPVTE